MFNPSFRFKQFGIDDRRCGLKVGTDGVILGAWAECPKRCGTVLDVGAGSGLVGLMLAQRYAEIRVVAVEIDEDSFADMELNVAQSPWGDRFELNCADFRSATGGYDLIVCNPPFFTTGERAPQAARALARHASDLSPVSFVKFAAANLAKGGRAAMIAPSELNDTITFEAALAGLHVRRVADVATSARRGVTRRLWEFASASCPSPEHTVIEVGSDGFKTLTADFYL